MASKYLVSRANRVLLFACAGSVAMAALGQTSVDAAPVGHTRKIAKLYTEWDATGTGNKGLVLVLDQAITGTGCTNANEVAVDPVNKNYDALVAISLSAHLANKNVYIVIETGSCYYGHARVHTVRIQ